LHTLIGRQQVDLHFLREQCSAYEGLVTGLRAQLQEAVDQRLEAHQAKGLANGTRMQGPAADGLQPSSPSCQQLQKQQQQQGKGGRKGNLLPCCEKAVEMYKTKYHRCGSGMQDNC